MKPMDGEEQISWSTDGRWLAYTCKKLTGRDYATTTNSEIYLYDTDNQNSISLTEGFAGYDKNPSFSPDGRSLIWMSQKDAGNEAVRRRLFILDMTSKVRRELTKDFDNDVEEAKWSPSGRRIYFMSGLKAT